MDAAVRDAIENKRPTRPLAEKWGMAEWTVRDRGRRIGAIPIGGVPRTREEEVYAERQEVRFPLPPGHPITWHAITAGTCLEGVSYE